MFQGVEGKLSAFLEVVQSRQPWFGLRGTLLAALSYVSGNSGLECISKHVAFRGHQFDQYPCPPAVTPTHDCITWCV